MAYNPVNTYLHEADDLLAEIEEVSLALDQGEPDPELVNQLFRAFHTIKGSGAMCGFQEVAGFTHHVETFLDQVRGGALPPPGKLTEIVLAAKDEIKALLTAEQKGEAASRGANQKLVAQFQALTNSDMTRTIAPPPVDRPAEECNWRILFRPPANLLAFGGDPSLVLRDLRKLGECQVTAHTDAVPALDAIQPGDCYLWWTVALRTAADRNAIQDVFLFVEDGSTLEIEPVGEPESEMEEGKLKHAPPAPILVGHALACPAESEAGPPPDAAAPMPPPPVDHSRVLVKESTVRVPSARLDRLVGLVGELVVTQSRLVQAASRFDSPELAAPVEEIERLIAELRDDVLGVRMMPIGSIFGRFRRLVHDLSAELGKQIDLEEEGAETELDKSILDQLAEPLVHLLRNSIDHGVESPTQRLEAGKASRGAIRLSAVHTGSEVVVSVQDDGRGLDREAIRAKALQKQLVAPDANLSDKEILNLILLPGFSTASAVTAVSGRGVGMDVVRRQIDALRGSISISSEFGKGTRISLRLPLTLAIIEGLLLQVGANQFIVPMASVTENVELERGERARKNGRNVTAVRGELIPYIDLRKTFHIYGEAPAIEKIVIVQYEDQRVGLVVDRVLGTHQTVIQSLGKFLRKIAVVSGSTVMGDGRVALVLDVHAVVRHADEHKESLAS